MPIGPTAMTLDGVGLALAGLSALAAASFGLLDAMKAFRGGFSNVGLPRLRHALAPFEAALNSAIGPGSWWVTVRANWLNGVAKSDQKATTVALVKLGLTADTAPGIAAATHVNPDALVGVANKLAVGAPLDDVDLNVIGRMNVVLEMLLDAAYEDADRQFRNVSRLVAGIIAVVLSLAVAAVTGIADLRTAFFVGLLAVPAAPVAKDLASALSAATRALKAAKSL